MESSLVQSSLYYDAPGEYAGLDIVLDEPITLEVPDGFFIEDQGRLAGGGAITEVVAK